jgi:hypothetical protein
MMQQGYGVPNNEHIVVVYTASSWIEAIVVRGLLESSGIPSPALGDGNSADLSITLQGIEIYTLASQADRARQVIGEYLDSAASESGDEDEPSGEP